MIEQTWEELKQGKTLYLSGRQKIQLDEYVAGRNNVQRDYYARYFKFLIDPDDRERSTYECYCTKTFDEFIKASKAWIAANTEKPLVKGDFDGDIMSVIALNPKVDDDPEEQPDPAVRMKLETVLAMIQSMEDTMNVSVHARGGSYGGARLVIRDNKTDEELVRE